MKLPWSIQLLGGLRAHSADNVVVGHFRTQKTGALFAYLATHFRHPQSRETLIERFWPDDDFDAARQSLRVALAFLRRALEPEGTEPNSVLLADRVFVRLSEDAFSTDVCAFEAAIRRAQTPTSSAPAAALEIGARVSAWEEAIAAYGGPFLPGYYDDWILAERDRLHEIWCDAHVRLAACCDQSGDWRRGLAALDALASVSEAEGDSPDCAWSRDARALRERLQGKQKAAQSRMAPVSETVSPLQALLPTDGFWGREKEIADLRERFHDKTARLVTLTGPGGTGKTRLVLQAASSIAESSGDGSPIPVHIAPLAALFDPARLPDAISDALGLPRAKSANADAILDAVIARLSDGPPALLVLDNVEQIAGSETARVVGALLAGAPHITCFATSRRRIGVPGERLFAVPPLPLPDSVALFAGRAQAVNDDFDLTSGANQSDVEALCKELEGSPLAIELAAAWSAALSPVEIRERLHERFALLSSRKGEKTDRHRSLWAAIAWSYDLLPRDLQKTWARLSVFRDGWTLDAARAVTGDSDEIAESLARLRERSLLVSLHGAHTGSLRFGMLPSLREFAQEQMDALDDSRQKHAEFFSDLLKAAKPQLRGKQHAYWMKRLDDEMPNLRYALAYFSSLVKSDAACAEQYLFFASAFSEFCRHRGYISDAREQLDLALARTAALPLESSERQIARAAAVNASGLVAWMQGDTERATSDFETARAVWKAQNDIKGLGRVLGNLALLAMEHEEQERAWSLCDEALPLLKQIGDLKPIANALGTMGNARLEQERWDEGRAYHEESLALYRELGDTDGVSIALASLGYAAQHQADYLAARAFYKESLQIRHDLGDKWRVAFSLVSIGNLLWAQKIAAPALTLYAAAEKLRADLGAPVSSYRQKEFDEKQAAMRAHIGAAHADKAQAKGDGLDYEGAVAYARYALCREKPSAPTD